MRNSFASLRAGCLLNNHGPFTLALSALVVALVCMFSPGPVQGAFELNFQKYSTGTISDKTEQSCGNFAGGGGNQNCDWDSGGGTFDNTTKWRNEVIVEGGQQYWHQVVGDTTTPGFRQEAYIRIGTLWSYISDSEPGKEFSSGSTSFSDSGGFPSGLLGKQQAGQGTTGSPSADFRCEVYMGLGCDPLGKNNTPSNHMGDNTWTGNGTGNPTKAVFRMEIDTIATDGFYLEVFKDSLSQKHRITQTLNNGGMLSEFQADMRNSTFTDMNSPLTVVSAMNSGPGTFVNKLTFSPAINAELGNNADFDMATVTTANNAVQGTGGIQAGASTVTAGRYTYTAGGGWLAPGTTPTYYSVYYQGKAGINSGDFYNNGNYPIYDRGTYSFYQGGFDQNAVNYYKYLISAQNPCGGDPFC